VPQKGRGGGAKEKTITSSEASTLLSAAEVAGALETGAFFGGALLHMLAMLLPLPLAAGFTVSLSSPTAQPKTQGNDLDFEGTDRIWRLSLQLYSGADW